jgi:hypothetical protein
MILKKTEFEVEPNIWMFREVTLEKVRLLVGLNSTGKNTRKYQRNTFNHLNLT